jgi:hypothetical protein
MKLNIEGDLMRRVIAVLAAVAALVVPSSASATPSASVSPKSVDFGRVPYNGGCSVVADIPNEFCVTRTLTITNTGTETLRGSGAKACERYVAESNGCFTLHASWGGFALRVTRTPVCSMRSSPETAARLSWLPSRAGLGGSGASSSPRWLPCR